MAIPTSLGRYSSPDSSLMFASITFVVNDLKRTEPCLSLRDILQRINSILQHSTTYTIDYNPEIGVLSF